MCHRSSERCESAERRLLVRGTTMPKPHAPRPPTTVLYARVSSKEQEKEGFSIPAQLKLLRGYAAEHRLTVVEEFVDVETAKRSGRPGFTAMVAFFKKDAKAKTSARTRP